MFLKKAFYYTSRLRNLHFLNNYKFICLQNTSVHVHSHLGQQFESLFISHLHLFDTCTFTWDNLLFILDRSASGMALTTLKLIGIMTSHSKG